MHADPAAVDEDLGGVGDGARGDLLEILHGPLLEELEDRRGLRADAYVGHEGEILDEPDGRALGRLRRTEHAPEGVVQLTGPGQLAVAADRRVDATQVREGRGEGQSDIRQRQDFVKVRFEKSVQYVREMLSSACINPLPSNRGQRVEKRFLSNYSSIPRENLDIIQL